MSRIVAAHVATIAFVFAFAPGLAHAEDWSGPYVGLNAGVRWSDVDLTAPSHSFPDGTGDTVLVPARSQSFNMTNGMFGGHAGYNVLLDPNWLIGIEGSISWGNREERNTAQFSTSHTEFTTQTIVIPGDEEMEIPATIETVTVPLTVTTTSTRSSEFHLGRQGTIRGRFGFVDGSLLYYATAGIAFTDAEWHETITVAGGASDAVSKSETLVGFVVGGGAETFILPNWLLRLDYLYEDFGSMSIPLAFTTKTGDLDVQLHKLRLGVSWKF